MLPCAHTRHRWFTSPWTWSDCASGFWRFSLRSIVPTLDSLRDEHDLPLVRGCLCCWGGPALRWAQVLWISAAEFHWFQSDCSNYFFFPWRGVYPHTQAWDLFGLIVFTRDIALPFPWKIPISFIKIMDCLHSEVSPEVINLNSLFVIFFHGHLGGKVFIEDLSERQNQAFHNPTLPLCKTTLTRKLCAWDVFRPPAKAAFTECHCEVVYSLYRQVILVKPCEIHFIYCKEVCENITLHYSVPFLSG